MSGVALGIGRGSKMVSNSADWLLRDEFITDLAAGSVNGTAAEPGPGTRVVVDTANKVSIVSGELKMLSATASWGNPALYYQAITRETGRMLIAVGVRVTNTGTGGFAGFDTDKAGTITEAMGVVNNQMDGRIIVGTTNLQYAIVLRSVGRSMFVKGNQWTNWTYLRDSGVDTTGTLYPSFLLYDALSYVSSLRIPDARWLPTPIASDGFGSTFGVTDGLGHPEGIAGGIGAGGGGVAWSNVGSTWSVSGGKAINTAPSGLSQQISVLNASKADVFVSAALTRSAAEVGLVLNMDSASSPANGVLVYLDGTNCKINKIVAGVTSNVRTTAVTYSAGARLVVAKNGSEYRVYYNNALVGAANTISDAGIVSNTLHGLFSTDASNTLDDLTIYATGTGGEYAELDKWS